MRLLPVVLAVSVGFLWAMCAAGAGVSSDAGGADADDASLRGLRSANGLLNRGLYDLAVAEYRAFLAEHAEHAEVPVARYGLGVCLYRLERFDECVTALAPLRDRTDLAYPAEVLTILGQCYLAQGDHAGAIAMFDRVVEQHGNHDLADDAAVGAAEAAYLSGAHEDAASRCRRAASRWSKSPLQERVEFFWGASAMASGDTDTAVKRFEKLLADYGEGPFAPQAEFFLAQCLHRKGLWEQARKLYDRVVRRADENLIPDAELGLGVLAFQEGRATEARDRLGRFIQTHPESSLAPTARFNLGLALFQLDEHEAALSELQRSEEGLAGGEYSDDVAYWMAKCRLRGGQAAEAAERLGAAIEAFPKSELMPQMLFDRAVALLRVDQLGAALVSLDTFVRQFDGHELTAEALHLLTATEHAQGHYDKSDAYGSAFLERFGKHDSAPSVAFIACENALLIGRDEDAVKAYRRFLKRYPEDPQALKATYRLGSVLYRLQRHADAEPLLQAVVKAPEAREAFRSAWLALGDIHFHRSEWKTAESYLGEYVAFGAEVASVDDALLKLGLAIARQGRQEEALGAFDRAQGKRLDLGKLVFRKNRLGEAVGKNGRGLGKVVAEHSRTSVNRATPGIEADPSTDGIEVLGDLLCRQTLRALVKHGCHKRASARGFRSCRTVLRQLRRPGYLPWADGIHDAPAHAIRWAT